MTSSDFWTAASSLAQIASVAVSLGGYYFIYRQLRSSSDQLKLTAKQLTITAQAADLQALREFEKDVARHEWEIHASSDEEAKDHHYVAFLAFLEINAAAINNNLLQPASVEIIEKKIVDTISVIKTSAPRYRLLFEEARFDQQTFSNLIRLIKRAKDKHQQS
ncbi:hypothetical protein EYW49_22120 [Siculibacillus lacustris]|uniref:DUF4760 domain-containing protein n=1 Tax=Siculibacillus lacustris TaxID=1549641 RepID=A0A4Q9VCZ6_9HYPH|nr:hypothetical protein [Siculibacillus lacustris]TBW32405.1 hypothetical protein EYW49_22120 [Siculibacillus lacustris]